MKIKYFISNRFGGVSEPPFDSLNIAYHVGDEKKCVAKNRAILFQKAGIKNAQFANQIHSDTICYIDSFIMPPNCDGLITDKPNIPLAIMSADCYGVLLYDEKAKVIAALHAGRAGATKGIVQKALQMMREKFCANNIEAVISPGIGVCCYEISEELAATYPHEFIKNSRFLDIKAMIYKELKEDGVEYIQDYNICTCCNKNYFSYRRDKRTGRFASIIWMEE